MAFQKDKTGVAQTAANTASALTAAAVAGGVIKTEAKINSFYNERYEETFGVLELIVDADNEMFKAEEAKGGGSSSRSSGGGGKSSGGFDKDKKFEGDVDDAKGTDLGFGAFKGLTLGEVYKLSADECAKYGYGDDDNPKNGKGYVKWLEKNTKDNSKDGKYNTFMAGAAHLIIEDAKASSDD